MTKEIINDLVYKVIGAAIEVHKELGPGLLESVYHKCMKHELQLRGINFQSELIVPITYKAVSLNAELRCDLFVENCLVVELKAMEGFSPIHESILLTYMNLLDAPKGLLINFNCTNIYKEGQKTMVNNLFKNLPDK
jgi:GxxExxY protein